MRHRFNFPAQSFTSFDGPYNLIWIQWLAAYINDFDLLLFLNRARAALGPGGLIVVKENDSIDRSFLFNLADCSITRSDSSPSFAPRGQSGLL